MAVKQNNLFGSFLPRKQTGVTENKQNILNAVNRVKTSKEKFQPQVILPQYSILRQKIIMISNLVKQGKLITHKNYRAVTTKDELWKVVKHINETKKCVWDTETDSKDPTVAQFVGMSLMDPVEDKHIYVPSLHCNAQKVLLDNQLTYKEIAEVIGETMENPNIKKFGQNLVYDNRVISNNLKINVKGTYWDTLIAMQLIDENRKNNKLKHLYRELVLKEEGKDTDTFEALFKDLLFCFVPIDVAVQYAAGDTDKTNAVYEWQNKFLSKSDVKDVRKNFLEIQMPQVEVVTAMENRGMSLDTEYAKALHEEYDELLGQIKSRLDIYFKNKFGIENINYKSSSQIAELIYDKLKCPPVDKKKPRGTGTEIIQKLVSDNPSLKILQDILTYRGTSKLLDTYIDSLPNQVAKDNRLHCRFNINGAKTGRYSSSNPNFQNIPSHHNKVTGKDDFRIRWLFVPKKDHVLLSSDFSLVA